MPLDFAAKLNAILNAILGFLMAYNAVYFCKSKIKFKRVEGFIFLGIGLYWGIFYIFVFLEEPLTSLGSVFVGQVLVRPTLALLFTTIIIHMMWKRRKGG